MIPKRKTCPLSELSRPRSAGRLLYTLYSLVVFSGTIFCFHKRYDKNGTNILQYPLFIVLNPKIVSNFSFAKTNQRKVHGPLQSNPFHKSLPISTANKGIKELLSLAELPHMH